MLLESVILLAGQELVHSKQPARVGGFAFGLRSGVGVTVEIIVSVAHVLGRVDLVELTTAIRDLEWISGAVEVILSQVGTHKRSVSHSVVHIEGLLETVGDS